MSETPSYYKLQWDLWHSAKTLLPEAQLGKFLCAVAEYYFTGTEPPEGRLPKNAQALFDSHRSAIASYRRNALNGTKNSPRRSVGEC